jgi:hypothetical protein
MAIAIELFNPFDQVECNHFVPSDVLGPWSNAVHDQESMSLEPDSSRITYVELFSTGEM